ncbi:MAG: hypothetical protein ACE5E6_13030, partial [Phycisphaerae bacterium]
TFSSIGNTGQVFHNKTPANVLTGEIEITGDVGTGIYRMWLSHVGEGARVTVGGDLLGGICLHGDLAGDIVIEGGVFDGVNARITFQGMEGSARIMVNGLFDGDILFSNSEIGPLSQIVLAGGFGPNGHIMGGGDVRGLIHVGPAGPYLPPVSVTFDGSILLFGALGGRIRVVGCHDPADVLDICICGGVVPGGAVDIVEDSCNAQIPSPFWDCLSSTCP